MSDRLRAAARNLLETAESIRVEGRVKPQDAADLITDCEELRAALAEYFPCPHGYPINDCKECIREAGQNRGSER